MHLTSRSRGQLSYMKTLKFQEAVVSNYWKVGELSHVPILKFQEAVFSNYWKGLDMTEKSREGRAVGDLSHILILKFREITGARGGSILDPLQTRGISFNLVQFENFEQNSTRRRMNWRSPFQNQWNPESFLLKVFSISYIKISHFEILLPLHKFGIVFV